MENITGQVKGGKPKAIKDPRSFKISDYLAIHQLQIPDAHDWTAAKKNKWDVFGNNRLYNCTCAAAGHMIECWTANASSAFEITEEAIVNTYITLSNYDPITKQNDDGVYMLDALKYWRKNGIEQHRIRVFATVPHDRREIVKASIYLFGGIYVGLQLPNSILKQKIWEVNPGELTGDNEPWSWGGHAVAILAYDKQHLTCIHLGKEQKMTWDFWETYNDEAYAIITQDFMEGDKNPLGFNLEAMERDLMELTQAKIRLTNRLAQEKSEKY
ncbi:hypothetical protein ACS5PU_10965 [Pedobacter sp. GSP4]|uniref:hypothetical protein n=1 Tax=Pedobacter sp. GSP4 TaxID=3453716 RepID=UPI003EEE880E